MTSLQLRALAACWLRYNRQCPIVAFERGLSPTDRPDVFGVDPDQRTVEIEVKISLSDFRADLKKRKWQFRRLKLYAPSLQYYVVPAELADKVRPILPDGCGLLVPLRGWSRNLNRMNPYTGMPDLSVVVRARRAHEGRITMREVWGLIRHQSGTLCHLAAHVAKEPQP